MPNNGSISATVGVVKPGNVVEIVNVFGETENTSVDNGGHVIDFMVMDTINQPSASDAGRFEVTTRTYYCDPDGECGFYDVDQGASPDSFTATPGSI